MTQHKDGGAARHFVFIEEQKLQMEKLQRLQQELTLLKDREKALMVVVGVIPKKFWMMREGLGNAVFYITADEYGKLQQALSKLEVNI